MDVHTAVYGLTGQIGVTYPAFADENLRVGANVVTQVPWSSIGEPFFNYGTIGSRGSPNYRTLGFQALPGDSGVGFFFEEGGEYHLGGITSGANATADTHETRISIFFNRQYFQSSPDRDLVTHSYETTTSAGG